MLKAFLSIVNRTINMVHFLINKWVLLSQKVNYMEGLTIQGVVHVRNTGKISLGKNVTIHNSTSGNIVGIAHRSILCTLNLDSVIEIGDNVGISGASIVAANSIHIGHNVLIGSGVAIWDSDFHPINWRDRLVNRNAGAKSEKIVIEDNVFIGARSIILKGVHIGSGSVVGAGSIVSKNVPANSIVVGNNVIKRSQC